MPASANITTSGVIAFTLPVGAWGVRIANESDTTIRRMLGSGAATSGATLGIPIKPGGSEVICFKQALKNPLPVGAIHAGSGNKTLTYEVITQETQATAVGNEAAQVTLDSTTAVKDNGPGWTTVRGISGARFTSADQSAAVASITDAPTSGQKLVITDLLISSDTALRLDFNVESSATVIETVYMAAGETKQITLRSTWKLPTADKKLQVKASAAGNISLTPYYYSEA